MVSNVLYNRIRSNIFLYYTGTSTAYAGAFFGQSTYQSFLDGLVCSGREQTLLECGRYSSIYATGCGSTQNAGVTCSIGQKR